MLRIVRAIKIQPIPCNCGTVILVDLIKDMKTLFHTSKTI